MKRLVTFLAAAALLAVCGIAAADDAELLAEIQALKNRVAELETQQQHLTAEQRNAELLEQLVKEIDVQPRAAGDTTLMAGYDKRFFIQSADEQFRLEFDTRLQFRYYYLMVDDCEDGVLTAEGIKTSDGVDTSAQGFEIERARLYLSGHVLKDLKYKITLAAGDDSGDAYLYEYELKYSFMPELGIRVGRFKGPYGKQETTSSGRLMLVDRSLANEVFNIDRVTGVELFGKCEMGDVMPEYRVMAFSGLRNNNEFPVVENDNSVGLAARVAVPLMGATSKDFENESDLAWHDNPVAQIGCSFAYGNDREEDHFLGGESDRYKFLAPSAYDCRSDVFTLGGEMALFGADVAFKSNGLSLNLEGFLQCVDVDSREVDDASDFGSVRNGIGGDQFDNYGWTAQAGYFIVPQTFEFAGRVSGVCVDGTNDMYEYAGGWNWYLSGQDLKLSMDLTYIDDLPIESSSPSFYGIQNNSLFMVRTQLQFQF